MGTQADPTGLYCFLDDARPCSAECMAYDAAPEGADYRDKQWANCMLLVNAHRGGKHLIVLASLGSELLHKTKNAAADAARANQTPPPVPK